VVTRPGADPTKGGRFSKVPYKITFTPHAGDVCNSYGYYYQIEVDGISASFTMMPEFLNERGTNGETDRISMVFEIKHPSSITRAIDRIWPTGVGDTMTPLPGVFKFYGPYHSNDYLTRNSTARFLVLTSGIGITVARSIKKVHSAGLGPVFNYHIASSKPITPEEQLELEEWNDFPEMIPPSEISPASPNFPPFGNDAFVSVHSYGEINEAVTFNMLNNYATRNYDIIVCGGKWGHVLKAISHNPRFKDKWERNVLPKLHMEEFGLDDD
jgi:hypothetical protein